MKFKIYFFLFLFFYFTVLCRSGCPCSGSMVGGSYLRVGQLGYGWLIPDEQVDSIYNPAALNNIIGRRLFSGFSAKVDYYYEINNLDKYFNSSFFLVVPFDDFKIAVKYSPEVNFSDRQTMYYILNSMADNFEFLSLVGFQFGKNIKIGLSFGVDTLYYHLIEDYKSSINDKFNINYTDNYLANAGVIFQVNDFFDLGVSFGGSFGSSKKIYNNMLKTRDNNLKLHGGLLPEFIIKKVNEMMLFRSLLSIVYESILTDYENELLPNNVERYYNLGSEIGTGLYYELKDKTILTCGLKLDWTIKNISRTYGINVTDTQTRDGVEFTVFIGMERGIVVDWILLRIGYKILRIYYSNYLFERELYGYNFLKTSSNHFNVDLFPDFTDNFSFGVGVKFGNNILLNVDFGEIDFSIYQTETGKHRIKTGLNAELNFIFE